MQAASQQWTASLQQKLQLMATTNGELNCLLKTAGTQEERCRLFELLAVLGARTAMRMLDYVACTSATGRSVRQTRAKNSCADLSFKDIEILLEDAIVRPVCSEHHACPASVYTGTGIDILLCIQEYALSARVHAFTSTCGKDGVTVILASYFVAGHSMPCPSCRKPCLLVTKNNQSQRHMPLKRRQRRSSLTTLAQDA